MLRADALPVLAIALLLLVSDRLEAQDENVEPSAPLTLQQRALHDWLAPPAKGQGLGQLLVTDPQDGAWRRLNVARYHVNVVLAPPVALVQIDQTFYNPYDRQEEGTFIFNLPPGASVSRFAMYVNPNDLIEGELIERERARNVYDSIVRRRRDPAILEEIGDNLFRMRVFPIFARDVKRILLDFTLPIVAKSGLNQFSLPLLSDLAPVAAFRLTGVVRGAKPDSIASPTFSDLKTFPSEDKSGGVRFEIAKENYEPSGDFVLDFTSESQTAIEVCVHRKDAALEANPFIDDPFDIDERGYFLATIPLAAARIEPALATPADVLILADTSSGAVRRKEGKGPVDPSQMLSAIGQAVGAVAASLEGEARVRLACVDLSCRALGEWTPPGSPEFDKSMERFSNELFLGATNLEASLREAAELFPPGAAGRRRVIVYIGDGIDTVAESKDRLSASLELALNGRGIAFSAIKLAAPGGDAASAEAGAALLEHLAEGGGGMVFDSRRIGDRRELVEWAAAGAPLAYRLASVHVPGARGDDLFTQPTWSANRPLAAYGCTEKPDELKIDFRVRSGKEIVGNGKWRPDEAGSAPAIARIESPGIVDEHIFVGRLWAQFKLDQLRRSDAVKPKDEPFMGGRLPTSSNRKAIIALSQAWGLLSPHTAFVGSPGTELEFAL